MQQDQAKASVDFPGDESAAALPTGGAAKQGGEGALVGCLWIAGAALVAAFFYFGFFGFVLLDYWNQWGILGQYLDERTSQILYVVYWPLIQLTLWLELA